MKITRTLACGLQAFITICMVAVLVAACGGGGGGGSSNGGSGSGTPSAAIVSITATPMKGQFCAGAQVAAYDINNVAVGSAYVNSSGVANLTIPANTAFPLHLTAGAGSNGSCYWDEALGNFVSIPPQTAILNAAIPSLQTTASSVGITIFTELAFQNATSGVPVTSLTASNVQAANTLVAELFGLTPSGVTDVLTPPTIIGQNTPKITSTTAPGDVYALAVAAMAKLSAATMPGSTPAQVATQWLNNAKANPASGVSGLPEAQGWGAAWTAVTTGASSVLAAGVQAPQTPALSSYPLIGPTISFNSLNSYAATHGLNGNFVISGWIGTPSNPASGSGVIFAGPAVTSVLNGVTVLQQDSTSAYQLSSTYGTSSYGGTVTTFLDPVTYAERVVSSDSYTEISPYSYPATIRAGDNVTLTASNNEYLDSSKTTLIGTKKYSYSVASDSTSSLLLTFIIDWYNTSNTHTYQEQDTFRVTMNGTVTPVSFRIINYGTTGSPYDLSFAISSSLSQPSPPASGNWRATATLVSNDISPQFWGAQITGDDAGDMLLATHTNKPSQTVVNGYQKQTSSAWSTPFALSPVKTIDPIYPAYLLFYEGLQLRADSAGNAVSAWVGIDKTNPLDRNHTSKVYVRNYNKVNGWGATSLMQSNPVEYAASPNLVVQRDGTAWIVWTERTYKDPIFSIYDKFALFAAKYTPLSGWSTAEKITTDYSTYANPSVDYFAYRLTGRIATDNNGNPTVLWTDGLALYSISKTGGTWGTPVLVAAASPAPGIVNIITNFNIAVDGNNNAIAVWQRLNEAGLKMVYSNRYVAATGWGNVTAMPAPANQHSTNPVLAMDNSGNAFLLWSEFDGSLAEAIWAARFDHILGWQTPTIISSTPDFFGDGSNYPQIGFDTNGNAIAIWMKGTAIWACRYNPNTGWSASEAISNGFGTVSYPQLAVSSDGHATAIWGQDDIGNQSYKIWSNDFTP